MPFALQAQNVLQGDDDIVRITVKGKVDQQIMKVSFRIAAVMEKAAQSDAAVVRKLAIRLLCRIIVVGSGIDDAVLSGRPL